MPLPQLWSVLYFFMLLLLGMGSMLGNVTAIITPLRDFKLVSRMSIESLNGEILADIDGKCRGHLPCGHHMLLVHVVPVNYWLTGSICSGFVYIRACLHTLP